MITKNPHMNSYTFTLLGLWEECVILEAYYPIFPMEYNMADV